MDFAPGKMYKVTFVINNPDEAANRTYDIYVDEELVKTGLYWKNLSGTFGNMRLHVSGVSSTTEAEDIMIDNIKILGSGAKNN